MSNAPLTLLRAGGSYNLLADARRALLRHIQQNCSVLTRGGPGGVSWTPKRSFSRIYTIYEYGKHQIDIHISSLILPLSHGRKSLSIFTIDGACASLE